MVRFENFELLRFEDQQIIELVYEGITYDLHNAAEFKGFSYEISPSALNLFWEYFLDENVVPLTICFEQVRRLEILPRDPEMPESEDDCLMEMTLDEQFGFEFMGGVKISVVADSVRLIVNEIKKQEK